MDYEKKYKDALERARKSYDKANSLIKKEWIETIFPELKESEDEKIRKAIIEFFECQDDNTTYSFVPKQKILDWLKKQGEQKSIDTITPKFKIGDWVILDNNHNNLYQIEKIENYRYFLGHFLGGAMLLNFCNENNLKLWTIEDAKDGDVLAIGNEYFLFKGKKEGTSSVYISHCFTDSAGTFRVTNGVDCGEFFPIENGINVRPATKEQRDFLFQKMTEAGYNLNKED